MKIIEFMGRELKVHDDCIPNMFEVLSPAKTRTFLIWAKNNSGLAINPIWHPIIQDYLYTQQEKPEEMGASQEADQEMFGDAAEEHHIVGMEDIGNK